METVSKHQKCNSTEQVPACCQKNKTQSDQNNPETQVIVLPNECHIFEQTGETRPEQRH